MTFQAGYDYRCPPYLRLFTSSAVIYPKPSKLSTLSKKPYYQRDESTKAMVRVESSVLS